MKSIPRLFQPLLLGILLVGLSMVGETTAYVQAATIHVPADYATIQAAIDAASDGDTIIVTAGDAAADGSHVYTDGVTINKAITLVGKVADAPGAATDAPVIDGSDGSQGSGLVITASDVTVEGFIIQHVQGVGGEGSGIRVAADAANVTIRHNTLRNNNWAGILAWSDGSTTFDKLTIEHNSVTMGQWSPDTNVYGIECTNCTNSQIRNNQVTGGYVGIVLTAQSSAGQSMLAENNTMSNNTVAGSAFANIQLVGFDPAGGDGHPMLKTVVIEENELAVDDGTKTVIAGYPLKDARVAEVTLRNNTIADGEATLAQTPRPAQRTMPSQSEFRQSLSASGIVPVAEQTDANMLDLRHIEALTIISNTIISTERSGAILFATNSSPITVTGNGITSYQTSGPVVAVNTCQDVTVQNNDMGINDAVGNDVGWRNHVVDLYLAAGTTRIENNRISLQGDDSLASQFLHGINVQGNVAGSLTIRNNNLQGNQVGQESAGIRLRNPLVSTQSIDIRGNYINGFAYGLRSDELVAGMGIDVHENHLGANAYGLFAAREGAPLHATDNWWGHATGPTHRDNPAGSGVHASGVFIYEPWLESGEDHDPATRGFQSATTPSDLLSSLYLPAISIYPGVFLSSESDLTITSIRLDPDKRSFAAGEEVTIIVEVMNQGTQAANPFWVDLFINPDPPPDASGILWNETCSLAPCFGIVWQVETLQPGDTATLSNTTTLRSTPASYYTPYTRWPGWFASGTTDIYVYADSWDGTGDATGGVTELNEENNRGELHGLQVSGQNPEMPHFSALQQVPRPGHPRGDTSEE